jgi:hypothetical protein
VKGAAGFGLQYFGTEYVPSHGNDGWNVQRTPINNYLLSSIQMEPISQHYGIMALTLFRNCQFNTLTAAALNHFQIQLLRKNAVEWRPWNYLLMKGQDEIDRPIDGMAQIRPDESVHGVK